jgi:adenylate cyclase
VWHNNNSMNSKTFFAELKRRNVYKVAVAYAVVAWLLIQVASILLPILEAPSWVIKAFVVFLVLGFAVIVYISWAFEATPQGLKRTENVSPEEIQVLPSWSPRKFTIFIVTTALLAASLLVFDLLRTKPASPPAAPAPAPTNTQ